MIESMAKLTLLFRPAGRDLLLSEMQKLGLVHIERKKLEENAEISKLTARIAHLTQNQAYLSKRSKEIPQPPEPKAYDGKATDLVRKIDSLRSTVETCQSERVQLQREFERIARWGDFDPDKIKGLSAAGLQMTLHSASRKVAEEVMHRCESQSDHMVVPVFEEGGKSFFAIVGPADEDASIPMVTDEPLPERSVSSLKAELEKLDDKLSRTQAQIDELLPYGETLSQRLAELQNELSYQLVRGSVNEDEAGNLHILTGWIPASEQDRFEQFLQDKEAVYLLEAPQTNDQAPVKLRNSKFTKLFEPILRIFSLPNYREMDPTPFFAPFYTLFFGLCVADLGYGILLLIGGLIALAVIKRKSVRPLLYLILVLSTSVAVCGFLLNDFFGLKITELANPHSPIAKAVAFDNIHSAMMLAIVLGIVQIMLGYVLRAINQTRAHGLAGGLKPLGVVLILLGVVLKSLSVLGPAFAVGPLPFGAMAAALPHSGMIGYVLLGAGLLLLLLFNSLEKKIFIRPLTGLWELYELLTTVPGYILSYLRLFALGLAGALLGETTIKLAEMVRGHSAVGFVLMILVFLLGSLINFAIGLLSAFVHSLRLTFVEFYNSLGFKGGGLSYEPFKFKS